MINMLFEIPLITDDNLSEGLQVVFHYVNKPEVSGGLFSIFMLLTLFIIILTNYVYFKRGEDIIGGFALSSFIVMILSVLFRIAEIVSKQVMVYCIAICIICVAALFFNRKD